MNEFFQNSVTAGVVISLISYFIGMKAKKKWKLPVLTSLGSVLALAVLFRLSHEEYVTLLPKSVTTAIGMGVSEELGGYVVITTAVIIITGVLGNMIAEPVCRIFRIRHAVSKGIAIGTASHAIGTAKAMEMGEIEGAMSSLAIVISGLCTVAGAAVFAGFLK